MNLPASCVNIRAMKRRILFLLYVLFLCERVCSQNLADEILSEPWQGVVFNGVCWAKSNVDKPGTFASTPRTYGMLYQWGAKKEWIATDFATGGDTIISVNDPCPVGWRMPTIEEAKTLILYGTVGRSEHLISFQDYNSSIPVFFPVVGLLSENYTVPVPRYGYWSGSVDMNDSANAWMYFFIKERFKFHKTLLASRDYPFLIRCVKEKCDSIVRHDTVSINATDFPYEWGDTTFLEGTRSGTYCIQRRNCAYTDIAYLHLTVQSESEKPCPGVLINGVCWAEYNVAEPGRFANPGNAYGMLYQWNRRKGWPAMTPDSVSGWDSTLEPGDTWAPANDPCPIGWRMPSVEEIKTLLDRTNVSYVEDVSQDRVSGIRYTDITTGNMIFFPQANIRQENGVAVDLYHIHYWSSTNYWTLYWNYSQPRQMPYAYGFSVRCVADENACDIALTVSETICKEGLPYTWHDTTFKEGTVSGEYCIRRTNPISGCDSVFYLYLTVDTLCGKPCKERGVLINGVCWAESNVDTPNTFADTPEAFGLMYQWNRKKGFPPKGMVDIVDWLNHNDYNNGYWKAVNNPCPADWRIPTIGDIYSLLEDLKVTREWTQQNGVNGMRFTDKTTGNTIFMPAAEHRIDAFDLPPSYIDGGGHYWSTTRANDNSTVYVFDFYAKSIYTHHSAVRIGANSVRCVAGRDTTGCSPIVTDTSETVCVRDLPYPWGDTTFDVGTQSGVYRFQHISTVTGCDSIVTLRLTVHASDTSFFDGVCYGSPYDNYGFSLPAVYRDTVIHDTLQSVFGCDSVRTLHLTVNSKYNIPLYDTVCQGDAYNQHGFSLSNVQEDGIHTLSLLSQVGCDSTLTLYLTVHPVYDTLLYDTVCQGDAYNNHGFSFNAVNASLTRTQTFQTIHGCDSIVTLNLHVWPSYLFSESKDICEGDTIKFRERKLYQSGVYDDTLKSVHGCDSVRRLDLHVHPKYAFSFSGSVCEGNGYHEYGFNLPAVFADTIVRDTFKTSWGCDSILTLHLTVHPVYDTVLYDTICQGDAYNNHGFSLPSGTSGGTFTESYSTIHGCDSTVTLNLFVWPSYLFSESKDICEGDTFNFRERKLYQSGIYDDTLKSVHGCDSIHRLFLTVHSTAPLYFPDEVCYGSPYDNHGFHLPAVYWDTVVRDSFRSIWGCDSIRILSLRVHPVYDTLLYDTVCQGDSYRKYGFSLSSVQSDGLHTLPLLSRWGCDSVVRLQLTVHPVYHTLLYDSICPSVRYDKYGFKLTDITESLTRTRRLSTIYGCDSLVTLELYVHPTYFFPLTKHICEGDTFAFRGNLFYESGVYYDSLTTIHGCDSVYGLSLTVHPVYDIPLSGVLCEGAPYTGYGFHVTTPGVHHRYLQTSAGCDSTLTLTLSEEKKIEGAIGLLLEDCRLHGYEFFFEPLLSHSTWFWDMGDGRLFHTPDGYHTYADSGLYRVQLRLETANGCENNYSYLQYVPPYLPEIPIHLDRQVIDEDYPTVRFRVDVLPGMTCEWDFGDGTKGEGDTTSHTYNATTEKYYDVTLQVKNADSCVTESRVQIEVVFLPKPTNTFSPNGDGINDIFMGDYRIEIIDRNGLRIFTGENGWDGTYQGRQAKEDTYFYRLHYRTANGERQKTGYVTLIR